MSRRTNSDRQGRLPRQPSVYLDARLRLAELCSCNRRSAQIPAIRRMFAEQFGEAKLKAQDYLTTVASGLGLTALQSHRADVHPTTS